MTGTAESQIEHPAHLAGCRSREAALAKDKDAWLALFADDAIVEDPIGPSFFDPAGKGHRGRDEISKFYDKTIGAAEAMEFDFRDSFRCGNEEANVGAIITTYRGYRVRADGVFTYRVNDEGKIVALRAYWETERAAATARKV